MIRRLQQDNIASEAVKVLKETIAHVMERKIDYSFLFFHLLFFSQNLTVFTSDTGLLALFAISICFCLFKKRTISPEIFKIISIFVVVFFIPALLFNYWNFDLFFGSIIRLTTGFIIVDSFGEEFIELFYNLMVLLALISIFFYFIQILYPDSFHYFNYLKFYQPGERGLSGHVNLIIYHFNAWAKFRNSGFMWEPAAFGATLAWALTIHCFKNRFKMDIRAFVLVVAMLTTISVGTYVYLSIFALLFFINQNKMWKLVLNIVFFIGIFFFASKIAFVEKQANYIRWKVGVYQEYSVDGARKAKATEVPRTTGFLLDLGYFIKNPLGYGFYRNQMEYPRLGGSPCGLSRFFVKWGILGLCILIVGYTKYITYLKKKYRLHIKGLFLFVLIFLLTLFGNPIDYSPFTTVFFLIGFNLKRIYYLRSKKRTNILHLKH